MQEYVYLIIFIILRTGLLFLKYICETKDRKVVGRYYNLTRCHRTVVSATKPNPLSIHTLKKKIK